MYFLISSIIGYIFGCLNGSQLIGKYKDVSVKETGMKNAGATNATLVLGLRYGLVVLIIDVCKAIFSLLLTAIILEHFQIGLDLAIILLYVNALFIIIGHNYPFTMNFSGGKGTASLFGILLYLDFRFAFFGLFILLLFAIVSNYFVMGTCMLYISFIGFTGYSFGITPAIIALLLLVLFLLKHTENFKRILSKEEVKVTTLFRKEAS